VGVYVVLGFGGLFCWRRWFLHPKEYDIPLRGTPVTSLPRQRRLTRRKPTLPGAEQSRALGVLVSSYGHSSAAICRYRFEGPRICQFPGFVVRPLMAGALPIRPSAVRGATDHDSSRFTGFVVLSLTANAAIARSLPFVRVGATRLRKDGFRGGRGGPGSLACGLAHEVVAKRTTPSADSSVFADRATVPTRKRRRPMCTQGQRRYGRVSIGRVSAVRDKTTKPVRHEMPWPVAPRTADGRMGARVCDQGSHHETRVVCRRAAVESGRTCQPKSPPARWNQRRRIA